jgi:hypothetical protein
MVKEDIQKLSDLMKTMIRMTEKDGLERGFVLCDSWHIIPGEGSNNMMFIEPCPIDEKTTVSFHTHPSGSPFPSKDDIETWYKRKVKMACIGTSKTILCFI